MSVPIWQPGTLYQPNDLVIPLTAPAVVSGELINGNFEAGDSGWTYGSNWVISNGGGFDGIWCGAFGSAGPSGFITDNINNNTVVPVAPGQSITATSKIYTGGAPFANCGGISSIRWLDVGMIEISVSQGNIVRGGGPGFFDSVVTGIAPAGTAFAQFFVTAYRNSGGQIILVDAATWNYTYAAPSEGLIFKAIQTDAAYSASTEPVWPTTLLATVVDGGVTWQAVSTTRVVWEANPILVSGSTEPTFGTAIGSVVPDNTIGWKAITRRVDDEKCPQSKVVAIAASKIFAGDNDIVPYCATVNPLDWTARDDAGYLPFGLQTYGGTPITAMGLYRGNVVVFNSSSFQMWQVDQDPASMALLDAVPVGCTYPKSVQPLSNDLIFLSKTGIRNLSIAGASTNLQADGVGEPIDALVVPKIKAGTYEPIGLYHPAAGQYWLIFGTEAFVLTVNGAKDKSWSRYTFPHAITDWTIHDEDLYLRTDQNAVWLIDEDTLVDDASAGNEPIVGVMQWPHIDCGSFGTEKTMIGLDLVSDALAGVSVSVGYDQRNINARTDDYLISSDTLPGMLVPIPVTAPSFDLRLTFSAGQKWEFQAANLYLTK
jgi:hypothetical protein